MTLKVSPATRAGLLGGLVSGGAGALFFAAAHAIIIVPIWTRMGSGLILGALAGVSAGWALAENYPATLTLRAWPAALNGARFGAALWLLVAPVTAADALLREIGIAPRLELVAVGVAVALAIGTGAAFGWRRSRRRRGMMSFALATVTLTVAMAGPVPVGRSLRALGIFVAVLPAATLGGMILAVVSRKIYIGLSQRDVPVPVATRLNIENPNVS